MANECPGAYIEVVFNLPLEGPFSYRLPGDCGLSPSGLKGCRVSAPFGRRKLTGWVVGVSDTLPPGIEEAREVFRILDEEPLFDEKLLDLARWMASFYLCTLGEALSVMLPGGKREKNLPFLGLGNVESSVQDFCLSEEQQKALAGILKNDTTFHYLYGITGSGKTEVFLQAAEKTMARGQAVLFLVPEISLTHQMCDNLARRFQVPPAVLHSRLTPSQKLREWRRIQSGETLLVLGARSAVFAPVKNLGLIILDEEHESSYKSGSTPRYHGRQVAMKRCRQENAKLLMGSATPSVEAWYFMKTGLFVPHILKQRPAGGALPVMDIVDLKKSRSLLSQELIRRMDKVLKEKKQVILFLNRRGHSYFFHCRSCGYEMICSQCSVPLTFHKSRNTMICHYCGRREKPLELCPECGSLDVGYSGFGTEQVEEQVAAAFPGAVMTRLDTDSTRKKGTLQESISRFREGEIDILLGTQMVAKGLNFPGVKLVGIILADTGLSLPDFRAGERAFSLIVQVAGRAGRYRQDGEVLVQTMRPDHPAILCGVSGDMETWYEKELEARDMMGFPPFTRLIRIVYRGKKEALVKPSLSNLAQALKNRGLQNILGPAECPLGRISGNVRQHILLRCAGDFTAVHQTLAHVLKEAELPRGVYREIDMDPVQLL